MGEVSLRELTEVALEAARCAGQRAMAHFNAGVAVQLKADQSPVTIADRESEQTIRQIIQQRYPTHSILGEEHGRLDASPDYRWIIDPIDGTATFIRGVPFWGVLIGVEVRGRPLVGVIHMPALNETVHAAAGEGCWCNGRRCRVSKQANLADATLLGTCTTRINARGGAWDRLAGATKFHRTWGDCYGYVLVATGRAEIMVDPKLAVWDAAPLVPILTEAGGRFTTWRGEETIWAQDGVGSNGTLHENALRLLREEPGEAFQRQT